MKFLGTGSALPKKVVSNDDLAQVMDTSDEWIRSRTGIGMRHIAVEETTTSMAVEAAEKALADAKISGCEIDLIIAGTISPDYIFPSLACEVQAAIGAKSATAFDLMRDVPDFYLHWLRRMPISVPDVTNMHWLSGRKPCQK